MSKSTTKKTPARKATNPAAKERGTSKESAPKSVAPVAAAQKTRAAKPPRERDPRLPAVGATVKKVWRGKTLEVKCLAEGFAFGGETYRTLSAAAKAASGFPSVNGFLFFGLIPRAAKPTDTRPKTKAPAAKAASGKRAKAEKPGASTSDASKAEAK